MPTITIRAHGVSATRNQTVVNPETGEIVKLTAFQPPERTVTKGWTVNVARRNEQRLQQIDFDAVEGFPAFVTLTMPSQQMGDVSAAMFHGWHKRWLQFMKRHGMRHYYWILEFQASGTPIYMSSFGLTMSRSHWRRSRRFVRGSAFSTNRASALVFKARFGSLSTWEPKLPWTGRRFLPIPSAF